jgi:DNA-directed RNA polymerase subunit RPC12/RpoP
MFNIERNTNGIIVIEEDNLRGGNVCIEQDDLSKFLEWLKDGPYGDFTSDSIQALNNKKLLALRGLSGSVLNIRKDSVPELLAALGSVAYTESVDVVLNPSTSVTELADQDISASAAEIEPATRKQEAIQTVTPRITHVYRVAYVRCASCQTELCLEHRDNYAGQAISCPQCNQIILLED